LKRPVAVKPIGEIKAELEAIRAKKEAERTTTGGKRDWYGLVYCAPNGYASIIGRNSEGIWLGKTDEIIPYLKSKEIDGTNIDSVLITVEEFWSVLKTQSCHSDTKNPQTHIFTPPRKSNRATFSENSPKNGSKVPVFLKKDKKLLDLLTSLAGRDIGIPTIHRELNEHGYAMPYRTVGRWVAQLRSR